MDQMVMMVNYGLISLLALSFVSVAVGFLWLIPKNVRQGQIVRDQLAVRIDTARLAQLLDSMDIDRDEYLHTESVARIHSTLNQCNHCDQNGWCIQNTDAAESARECPIANSLQHFKTLQSEAA